MFDLSNLPRKTDVQIYAGGLGSTSAALRRYEWVKPPGASWVYIFLMNGGGSGASGASGAAGTSRNGGGGGGGSPGRAFFFPAIVVPRALHVSVGYGSNAATVAGGYSQVGLEDDTTTLSARFNLQYLNTAATAGAVPTGGNTSDTSFSSRWLGAYTASVAQVAGAGGSGVAGGSMTNIPIIGCGGAGGAGVAATNIDLAGGGYSASGLLLDTPGGAGGAAGINGVFSLAFPCIYAAPGTGGGSSGTGTGGRGGNGGFGCGGGGGGAGVTGGSFGFGGPGLIIIVSA